MPRSNDGRAHAHFARKRCAGCRRPFTPASGRQRFCPGACAQANRDAMLQRIYDAKHPGAKRRGPYKGKAAPTYNINLQKFNDALRSPALKKAVLDHAARKVSLDHFTPACRARGGCRLDAPGGTSSD